MKIVFMFLLCLILASVSTARLKKGRKVSCTDCPKGWTFWKNSCYRFFNNRDSTWDDAEAFCIERSLSKRRQSHLVTIDSEEENDFLVEWWRTMQTSGDPVWIGYNDKATEGYFVGPDGRPPQVTFWGKGEPNDLNGEDCVEMWKRGDSAIWNDQSCFDRSPFICKIRV